MQVTAALVKELRERSGAGMMECKKALVETDGDLESALEHLRKSGAAKAAKKAGRIASEGAIVVKSTGATAAILEVNSETDFVANDENFENFADSVVDAILESKPSSVDELSALQIGGDTVEAARTQLVTKIGENISIRRFELLENPAGTFASYLHGKRIGVLTELDGGDDTLARDIAMHIAASNPTCIGEQDVPGELLAKEKEVRVAQAEQSGKPPEIVEKMVTGQLKKFVNEITLEGQPFVKDPDKTVGKLLKENSASVVRFIRYEVGEGIEKKVENFAEEVMAQAKGAE
ncbi:MAG: translation elongation factor Ts [Pseudomonadota bacterium]